METSNDAVGVDMIQLVRDNWSADLSTDDVELILWNATSFPFGPPESVALQVRQKFIQSGGHPLKAVCIAEQEIDNAMAEYRNNNANQT